MFELKDDNIIKVLKHLSRSLRCIDNSTKKQKVAPKTYALASGAACILSCSKSVSKLQNEVAKGLRAAPRGNYLYDYRIKMNCGIKWLISSFLTC